MNLIIALIKLTKILKNSHIIMKVFWKRAEKGKPAYFPSVSEL